MNTSLWDLKPKTSLGESTQKVHHEYIPMGFETIPLVAHVQQKYIMNTSLWDLKQQTRNRQY